MNTITQEQVLEAGGKVWERGDMKRVYINQDTFKKLFDAHFKEYGTQFTKVIDVAKKAKTWYDCNTNTLHSLDGSIRSPLNATGYACQGK